MSPGLGRCVGLARPGRRLVGIVFQRLSHDDFPIGGIGIGVGGSDEFEEGFGLLGGEWVELFFHGVFAVDGQHAQLVEERGKTFQRVGDGLRVPATHAVGGGEHAQPGVSVSTRMGSPVPSEAITVQFVCQSPFFPVIRDLPLGQKL
jgi:hypothetical protein